MKDNFYMIGGFQIPQRIIQEKELWWLDGNNPNGIIIPFKELKRLSGYSFDNRHLYFSNIYGGLFAINIHFQDKTRLSSRIYWEITLWDERGFTSVGCITQDVIDKETDRLSNESYKQLSSLTEKYTKGIITCSNCGKEINRVEIAGRYFAGVYCTDCWETKYKAIEAKETYD